jgi:peptidyl-prolyl cis-trans isomerase D
MVKAFEEVAFSLEPGATSEVIRTSHGLHLIRLEERQGAIVVPFEEVQDEIARDLARREKGAELARARAEELAAAIREGHSLLEVAREVGLNIERTDRIRHRPDGYVPGLGAVPQVLAAAFALSEEEPSSAEIFPVQGDAFVLIQLLERVEPDAEEIEAQLEGERERLLTQRRNQIEQTWVTASQESLAESGRIFYSLEPMGR